MIVTEESTGRGLQNEAHWAVSEGTAAGPLPTRRVERGARAHVVARRLEKERILTWLTLALPLAISATLNLWNLAQNGFSNLYYSVAVQSMSQSLHNFFFNSYDAGGYISVDKPPVALWIQTISVKLFGFNSLSLLVPEALAGVACVALVNYLVKRLFGLLAAFVAAMALALTPIAVAVERTNNTDTWLMLALLLSAWALTLATEKARFGMLALSMALAGVAFNVKMLAAFVVLPAFYLVYFVGAPTRWPKRLLHLALASVVLGVVSLSWPVAVDLTPASQRPWVGGSQANSVLDLALNYNGLGRVTGNEGVGGPGFGRAPGAAPPGGLPNFGNGGPFPGGPGGAGGRGGPFGAGGMFGAGYAGPLRLFFGGELAEQWSWLFPLAALGLIAAIFTVRRRWPLEPRGQALLLWAGWLGMYGGVFSFAEGIFHPYYLIMLAPGVAALVGIGVSALWRSYRKGGWQAWLLPFALLLTAVWQNIVLATYPQWTLWLMPLTLGLSLLTTAILLAVRFLEQREWRRWSPGLLSAGFLGLLIAPFLWSVTPLYAAPNNASLPVAGLSAINDVSSTWTRLDQGGSNGLTSYLQANRDGYFYLVAVTNSQEASSIALETGQPVLAMGGFMGSDPAMTVEKLQQMIANKQVRFVMAGVMGMGRGPGGGNVSVSGWVESSCTPVDSSLYGGQTGLGLPAGPGFMRGGGQLYNCAAP